MRKGIYFSVFQTSRRAPREKYHILIEYFIINIKKKGEKNAARY